MTHDQADNGAYDVVTNFTRLHALPIRNTDNCRWSILITDRETRKTYMYRSMNDIADLLINTSHDIESHLFSTPRPAFNYMPLD